MELQSYLKAMTKDFASDLFLITGAPPTIKVYGHMQPLSDEVLTRGRVRELANSILDDEQIEAFKHHPELNISLSEPGVGRFRINVFKQRNDIAMVFRNIKTEIPQMDALHLPPILGDFIMRKHGLILLIGPTGAGKSTSLASMIDYRNKHLDGHIITIEDPIEFIHSHNKSLVTQREIGIDTDNYHDALINAMRQAPDVICIGEIRDRETMQQALTYCESGHLCISTLHATNANQAIEKILRFFPDDKRDQILLELSLNMVAFVSQRLLPTRDGKELAAFEILTDTPLVRDLIKRNEVEQLKEVMEKSIPQGMMTFDICLRKLYEAGIIDYEVAMENADSQNNLRLAINLEHELPNDRGDYLSILEDSVKNPKDLDISQSPEGC